MHYPCGWIEDLNLFVIRRRTRGWRLRARIVKRAERIGRRIDRCCRDVRTIHGVEKAHRGAVGPSGYVNPIGIDLTSCDLVCDEMVDRCRVRIFTPGRVSDLYVTRRI